MWFDAVVDEGPTWQPRRKAVRRRLQHGGKRNVGICRYNPADNTWQRFSKSNSEGDFPPLLRHGPTTWQLTPQGGSGSPPLPV